MRSGSQDQGTYRVIMLIHGFCIRSPRLLVDMKDSGTVSVSGHGHGKFI
jgi:hypothetical protein